MPNISYANVNVQAGKNLEVISSSVEYGISNNPNFKNLPTVKVTFYTDNIYNFRIFFNSIETLSGSSTYKNDFILNYDPFLELHYEEPIGKDTIFNVNWAEYAPYSDGKIIWTLSDNSESGEITNNTFSIKKDVINNINSSNLGETIDVTISAKDKAFYHNNIIKYNYHIYDIETK